MISKDNKHSPHILFTLLTIISIIGIILIIQACTINIHRYKDYKVAYDINNTVVKDINGEQKEFTEKLKTDMLDLGKNLLLIYGGIKAISPIMNQNNTKLKLQPKKTEPLSNDEFYKIVKQNSTPAEWANFKKDMNIIDDKY